MLTFLYPWVFWLSPLPLLVRWLLPAIKESVPAVRIPFAHRLRSAGAQPFQRAASHWYQLALAWLVWLLLLVALARPQWLEDPIERDVPTRDLLCLVDLSGSMDHKDFQNAAGDQVNRLDAVKDVLGEFLAKREGDRVGLVVFGNAPFLQVPFTIDLQLCQQLLEETEVGMAGPRTALGDAIGLGIKLFENSEAPTKTMITLTDGNDTASAVPPVEAARVARDNGITIHSIAMGDPKTVGEEELDVEAMKQVASMTSGSFFLAMNREELAGVYERLDEIETRKVKTVSHRPRRDLFFWPVAVAVLVSLLTTVTPSLSANGLGRRTTATARLRVNTRTFELETTD